MTFLAVQPSPPVDWAGLSLFLALAGGGVIALLLGLLRPRALRYAGVPLVAAITLLATIALGIWQWGENKSIMADALRVDDFALAVIFVLCVAGLATVLLAARSTAAREVGHGELFALLLWSLLGMALLAASQNLVTLFLSLEILSIPLYVLCATEMRRKSSLESGLKYLVIGSVGSAILVYGLALIYGATGTTDFSGIAAALDEGGVVSDPLLLTGLAFVLAGLGFKASVAPFHQWTPDVYQGAPTAVTAFMAVATKAAAFAVTVRFLEVALIDAQPTWGPAVAVLATVTIVVGNVGALGQTSLKRLLAWSSVAQAGYILVGVVVASRLGVQALVFYLIVYAFMNLAAFAVVIARERETPFGDHIDALAGLGRSRPLLAWPMTIAMLALAGLPITAGFIGKIYLIQAAVTGRYTWLGVMIVVGSMISLAYYLKVVAAMWMRPAVAPATSGRLRAAGARPAMAGGAPEADAPGARSAAAGTPATDAPRSQPGVVLVAVVFGALSLVAGIVPGPLFDLAREAGAAFGHLI
jgi:NADH-quinone oxidoreductase subunit N